MKNTALITGSSKGIGRQLSLLLLQKGYTVFGYSRTNSIEHKNFHFNRIDLTKVNDLDSIRFPQVKKDEHICLINNAGEIGVIEKFGNKKTNDIINEFNINIVAPSILCNTFIKNYQNQSNHTAIMNISSGAALRSLEYIALLDSSPNLRLPVLSVPQTHPLLYFKTCPLIQVLTERVVPDLVKPLPAVATLAFHVAAEAI
jgi:short-subunit dehydrogenase